MSATQLRSEKMAMSVLGFIMTALVAALSSMILTAVVTSGGPVFFGLVIGLVLTASVAGFILIAYRTRRLL